jgi:hypothetical protein
MLVLSESFHGFESRIACRCNRFPSRRRLWAALSIWHQLTQSIQRGESSFQEKCMDFHEIHPSPELHTTWHMCVFHDLTNTLTNDVLHIALCVDIISFLLEFSFEFIWIFQNNMSQVQTETFPKNSNFSSCLQNIKLKNNTT